MSGNVKRRPATRHINVQFTEDQIERLERACIDEDIPRNKFIGVALDHYLCCKKR
jgi:hypothetical protein